MRKCLEKLTGVKSQCDKNGDYPLDWKLKAPCDPCKTKETLMK